MNEFSLDGRILWLTEEAAVSHACGQVWGTQSCLLTPPGMPWLSLLARLHERAELRPAGRRLHWGQAGAWGSALVGNGRRLGLLTGKPADLAWC